MTEAFDAQLVHVVGVLPELEGAAPPSACPICGAERVPPESDEGLPPIEHCEYRCNATYRRAEDAPGPWEPYRPCWNLSVDVALAWIGDATLRKRVRVALPPRRGERPPDACPVCDAVVSFERVREDVDPAYPSARGYECGALYWATSLRPGATGLIPMTWEGRDACTQPPVARILEIGRASSVST